MVAVTSVSLSVCHLTPFARIQSPLCSELLPTSDGGRRQGSWPRAVGPSEGLACSLAGGLQSTELSMSRELDTSLLRVYLKNIIRDLWQDFCPETLISALLRVMMINWKESTTQ